MSGKPFTLIELLVVIAIIAILAGILMPVFAKVAMESEIAATKMLLKNIGLACREYKNDWGVYPTEGLLYNEVVGYSGILPGGGKGPYLELDSVYLSGSTIVDYWGTAIVYDVHAPEGTDILVTDHNTGSFDLVSYGPDAQPGESGVDDDSNSSVDDSAAEAGWPGTDDVGNWED